MTDVSFTNSIRRLRFENNEMTQQALAQAAGCTRQTIIAIEQGRYNPSLALAFRIAQALNRNIQEVFHPTDKSIETQSQPQP